MRGYAKGLEKHLLIVICLLLLAVFAYFVFAVPSADSVSVSTNTNISQTKYAWASWNYTSGDNNLQNGTVYTWFINGTEAWKDDQLIGYWRLDSNTIDSSQYGNDGIIISTTNIKATNDGFNYTNLSSGGFIKGSIFFANRVNVTVNANLNIRNNITISGWVYATTYKAKAMVVKNGGANNIPYTLGVANGGLLVLNLTNSTNVVDITYPLSTGEVHFIAGTYNGNTASLYLDGLLVNSVSMTGQLNSTGGNVFLAAQNWPKLGAGGANDVIYDEIKLYNRTLSSVEIMQEYEMMKYGETDKNIVSGTPAQDIPNILYHLDENSGTQTNDYFGNTTGLIVGNNVAWTNGLYGSNALLFNTTTGSGYVNVSFNQNLNITNALTIEAWIMSTGQDSSRGYIVAKALDSGDYSWNLGMDDTGALFFGLTNETVESSAVAPSSITLNNYTWYHVAAVWNGTNSFLYVNGTLDGTYNNLEFIGPLNITGSNLTIGGNEFLTNEFNGTIEELVIYNRSLSGSEINQSYLRGFPHFGYNTSALTPHSNVSVLVEPNDGTSFGTAVMSTNVTLLNILPQATSVGLIPTTAYKSTSFNASVIAIDNELDTMTVTFRWYNNSVSIVNDTITDVANGTNVTNTIPNDLYERFGNISVEVQIEDPYTNGTWVNSSTVQILNSVPEVDGMSLDPTTSTNVVIFNVSLNAIDNDTDTMTVTFRWYVNNLSVVNNSVSSVTNGNVITDTIGNGNYTHFDNVTVEIQIEDPYSNSTFVNSSTLQVNVVPQVNSVSLDPTTAYATTTLNASVIAIDNDTDTMSVTFIWFVNGVNVINNSISSIANGTNVTNTISNSYYSNFDTVGFDVYANDNFGNSTSGSSSSVEILNILPLVNNVNVSSGTNVSTSRYAWASWNYTDNDSDTQNGTVYTWFVNGTEAWKDNQLIGYWRLDGNFDDSSQYGNNGTIQDGFDNQTTGGIIKGAFNNADHVLVNISDSLEIPNQITVSGWINLISLGSVALFARQGPDENIPYILGFDLNGAIVFNITNTTNNIYIKYPPTSTGAWHYIAGTYNGTNMSLYLDGKSVNSTYVTGTLNTTPGDLFLMARGFCGLGCGPPPGDGLIDELKLWNRSLSAAEILQEYNMMKYGQTDKFGNTSAQDIPKSLFHFDENSGTQTNDYFGNNNGSLINSVTWTSGIFGSSALSLDGIDDYASINGTPLIFGSRLTTEFWIKPYNYSIQSEPKIIMIKNTAGSGSTGFIMYINPSGNISVCFPDACLSTIDSLQNNTYTYLAFTQNNDTTKIYLNSVLSNSGTTDIYNGSDLDNLYISSRRGDSEFFNGSIDELAFYNKVLTAEEINQSYLRGYPIFGYSTSSLTTSTNLSVLIEPSDSYGFGTAVMSVNVTMQNTIPEATSVGLKPSTAYISSVLNASVIALDNDLDTMTVRFRWYNNSVNIINNTISSVSNGTNVTNILTNGNFSRFDNISVEIQIEDPYTNGTFVNSSVVQILNQLNISSCTIIDVPGDYTLISDISSSSGVCVNITSSNVYINGSGFIVSNSGTSTDGIYASNVNNITINNLTTAGGFVFDGIRFVSVNNSAIKYVNSSYMGSGGVGIELDYSNYSVFSNNILDNSSYGFYISHSSYNTFANNTMNKDGIGNSYAIYLDTSTNNLFTGGLINNSQHDAITFAGSSINNNFTGIDISNTVNKDIEFFDSGSDGNWFIDMNNLAGYVFQTPTGNIVNFKNTENGTIKFNQPVKAQSTNLSADLQIQNNFVFVNSSVAGWNIAADVELYNLPTNFHSPAVFRNGSLCTDCVNLTSLNAGNVSFSVTGWSNYTINSTNAVPEAQSISLDPSTAYATSTLNASVIAIDNDTDSMTVRFRWYNNSINIVNNSVAGVTNGTNVTNILTNGNFSRFDNISVEIQIEDPYTNGTFVNSSTVQILNQLNISSCTTIDVPGDYVLGNDINIGSGDCISITASNVTLDGSGFAISNTGTANNGITVVSVNNVTIKNVIIDGGFIDGINMTYTNNSLVENVTVNSNSYGINFYGSNNNIIRNVSANSNNYGIYFDTSSNNNAINSTFNFSSNNGIYIKASNNNTISKNNLNNNTNDAGILIDGSSGINENNTIDRNDISDNYHGVEVYNNGNSINYIINNIITNSSNNGLYISISNHSVFTNNTLISNDWGLYLTDANFNTFVNNTLNSTGVGGVGGYAIYLSSSTNNVFTGGLINNSKYIAIQIYTASNYNNFTGIVITNTGAGNEDIDFNSDNINGTWFIDMNNIAKYDFVVTTGNIINFKNTENGTIMFNVPITAQGTNLSADLQIQNNFVFVNSWGSSANVSLYNLPTNFAHPVILRDEVLCSDCTNFTSLNAGNVSFNVSGWSNYTIASSNTIPEAQSVSLVPTTAYKTTIFNASVIAIDNDSDNMTVMFRWYNNSVNVLNVTISASNGTNATAYSSEDGRYQTAVAADDYIYISSNYGNTWTAKDSTRNWHAVSLSANGSYQTAVAWNNAEIYVSSDYGNTWTLKNSGSNWDGVSISSSGQYQTAIAYDDKIYTSSDYGQTWTNKTNINKYWRDVSISSSGQYQTAVGSVNKIYTSSDYGQTWTNATNSNNEWYGISLSSSGQYQTALIWDGKIYTSSDYGQTWTNKTNVNRIWYDVSLSSSGQYQTAVIGCNSGSKGQIYISSDYGNTWTAKESNRGWCSVSLSFSGQYQTAVDIDSKIYISSDYGNTWMPKESTRYWYGISISQNPQWITYSHFDNVTVEVYADDGYVNSTYVNSSTIQISNTAPQATNVDLKPSTAYATSTLNASVIAIDNDTDTMNATFRWMKNNVSIINNTISSVANGTNVTNILTPGNFSRFDNITVEIQIEDPYTNGTFVNSSTVEILNILPLVNNVNVSSGTNVSTSRYAWASWNYSDNDSDSQNGTVYTWFINGTEAWKDPSLLGYWKLDGNATDSSGNGNNGTVNGATNTNGVIKNSYSFDGIDDYVDFGLFTPNVTTVSFWFKPSTIGDGGIVYAGTDIYDSNQWDWGVWWNGNVNFVARSGNVQITDSNATLNEWAHYVLVRNDSAFMKVYKNGNMIGNSTSGSTNDGILHMMKTGSNFVNAFVDEVKIFNRSLSSAEIKQEYQQMKYGQTDKNISTSPKVPVSLLHFDEGSGTTTKDYFGGNHGTLINSPVWNSSGMYGSNALTFNGVDSYVNVTGFVLPSNGTIEMWINPLTTIDSSVLTPPNIFDSLNVSSVLNKELFIGFLNSDGRLAFDMYQDDGSLQEINSTTNNWTEGQWYNVAFTWGSLNGMEIYVNGIKEGNNSFTGFFTDNSAFYKYLGAAISGSDDPTPYVPFNGSIEEFVIYNKSLSAEEINQSFLRGFPHFGFNTSAYGGSNISILIEPNDNFNFGTAVMSENRTISISVLTISSCATISVPGYYTLTDNILNSNANSCINITASDVTLDGQWHNINGSDATGYGINATGVTGITLKNLNITNWQYGIYLYHSDSSLILNNSFKDNQESMDVNTSYTRIINNTVISASKCIFLEDQSSYNNITGNSLNNGNSRCIELDGSNNNLINNNVLSGSIDSIWISTSNSNQLLNNTISSASGSGIFIQSSSSNIIENNNLNSNTANGIYLLSHNSGSITGNIISGNGVGIRLENSDFNNIYNNNASLNTNGIILSGSSDYNNLTNITINSNTNIGLYILSSGTYVSGPSISNSLYNTTINNNAYGIYIDSSNSNSVYNNSIANNTNTDIYLTNTSLTTFINNFVSNSTRSMSGNIFINTTFGYVYPTKISFTHEGNVTLNRVLIPSSDPIGYHNIGKYINITNTSLVWINLTIAYTDTDAENVTESNLSLTYYSGSWQNVISSSSELNTADNYIYANITFVGSSAIIAPFASSSLVSSCATINASGTYNLTQNILNSNAGSCINITASNVVLNGKGYTIDGVSTQNTYGVYVNGVSNVSLYNINVTNWYIGIFYNITKNSTIQNITSNNNARRGFHLLNTNNTAILNSTSLNDNITGVLLENSNNNNITNIISYNNSNGIYLSGSYSNIILNNSIDNSSFYGIIVLNSNSNLIYNNTVNHSSVYGIIVDLSNFTIIDNNTVEKSQSSIVSSLSIGNNITNNAADNSSNYGIFISQSQNNTVLNNKARENALFDIILSYPTVYCNNIIENNTGSGGTPIEYYSSSTFLENKTLSELLLCDADFSHINNVTILGSASKTNNGVFMIHTDSSNITNINSSQNNYGMYVVYYNNKDLITSIEANSNENSGVYMYASENNTISNVTANSNGDTGVYLVGLNYFNTVANSTTNSNYNYGIHSLSSDRNNFTNNIANLNYEGILFESSLDNTLYNNNVSSNTLYGIYLYTSHRNIINNNTFFNNFYNLELATAENNTITLNTFGDFTTSSIDIFDTASSNNTIYRNNFISNLSSNTYVTTVSGTDNKYTFGSFGGNFWENFSRSANGCTNTNNDFYCDASFAADGSVDAIDTKPFVSRDGWVQATITSCRTISASGEYILAQSIVQNNSAQCITITASNVILDGLGYTIDGNGSNYATIRFDNLENITIKNINITNGTGITSIGSFYTNITNSSFTSNRIPIDLEASNNSYIANNIIISPTSEGIRLLASDSNTVLNNTIQSSRSIGLRLERASKNTIINNTISASTYDVFLSVSSESDCNNNLQNNTGSGGKDILYYNSSAFVENMTLSDLILCNADFSHINNVTINTTGNMFWVTDTDNSNFTNIISSGHLDGIDIYSSSNNTFTSITANSNINEGIYINSASSNNIVSNSTLNSNNDTGIILGQNSTIINSAMNNNYYGIYIPNSNNTVTNNNITNSTVTDIYISSGTNNTFINNFVSNSTRSVTGNTFINTTFGYDYPTKISFTNEGTVTLNRVLLPPTDPSSYQNISKYINITNSSLIWILLNISYIDSDLNGVNETALNIKMYNGTWENVTENINGTDSNLNNVYANITYLNGSAIFAPLSFASSSISNITNSSITTSSVIISFVTDQNTNYTIYYGSSLSLGSYISNSSMNTNKNVSLSSLSSGTTYYYNITACNSQGSCKTVGPLSFTTTSVSTPSSSTGGGSAGGPSTNATKETKTVSGSNGTIVTINFTKTVVDEIEITLANKTSGVSVSVKETVNTQKEPEGLLYKYIDISKSKEFSIIKAKITFAVDKSWITKNNVNKYSVKLSHYSNGIWTYLKTTFFFENSKEITYQAETPSFSLFAIVGEPIVINQLNQTKPCFVEIVEKSCVYNNETNMFLVSSKVSWYGGSYSRVMIEDNGGMNEEYSLYERTVETNQGTKLIKAVVYSPYNYTLCSSEATIECVSPEFIVVEKKDNKIIIFVVIILALLCGILYLLNKYKQKILHKNIYKEKLKLPTIKIPELKNKEHKEGHKFKLPTIKLPEFKLHKNKEHKEWNFKLPTIKLPKITLPVIKLSEFKIHKLKNKEHKKEHKFKLPKIKLPEFKLHRNKEHAEKHEIKSKFKLNLKLPEFKLHKNKENSEKHEIKLPKFKLNIKLPSFKPKSRNVEIKPLEIKKKFKMPKIKLPEIKLPELKFPEFKIHKNKEHKEGHKFKLPEFKLHKKKEIIENKEKTKFKLPTIKLPEFKLHKNKEHKEGYKLNLPTLKLPSFKPKSRNAEIKPLEIKKKFKMPKIKMPEFKLPIIKQKESSLNNIKKDELKSHEIKINIKKKYEMPKYKPFSIMAEKEPREHIIERIEKTEKQLDLIEETKPVVKLEPELIEPIKILKSKKLGIEEVQIVPNKKVEYFFITVKEAETMYKPNGNVYKFVQLIKSDIKDNDIESIKIKFNVSKEWLKENMIEPKKINIYKLNFNKWKKVEIISTSTDLGYAYYLCDSGTGTFAIVG